MCPGNNQNNNKKNQTPTTKQTQNMTIISYMTTTGPFHWYQQAQLVMYDNIFYDMGRPGNGNHNTLETARSRYGTNTNTMSRPRISYNVTSPTDHFPEKYMLLIHFDPGFDSAPFQNPCATFFQNRLTVYDTHFEHNVYYDRITAPIKKIQRFMRTLARARIQAKHLAFAMGTHDRLGSSSCVCLTTDALRLVLSSC